MKKLPILLFALAITRVYSEEKWSWGKTDASRQGKALSDSPIKFTDAESDTDSSKTLVKKSSAPSTSDSKAREPRKIDGKGKSEARFLGLKKKMCEFGIGFDVSIIKSLNLNNFCFFMKNVSL